MEIPSRHVAVRETSFRGRAATCNPMPVRDCHGHLGNNTSDDEAHSRKSLLLGVCPVFG